MRGEIWVRREGASEREDVRRERVKRVKISYMYSFLTMMFTLYKVQKSLGLDGYRILGIVYLDV